MSDQTTVSSPPQTQDYRAYLIGLDGHIFKAVELVASDDTAAIAAAQEIVDGHDVELWRRDRKIWNTKSSE